MNPTPIDVGSILDRHRQAAAETLLAAAVRGELPKDRGAAIEREKARRGRLVERLDEAKETRRRAVERLDAEVVRIEARIEEIDELIKNIEEGGRGPSGPTGSTGPIGGRGGGIVTTGPRLQDIEGVGATLGERLATAGFDSVGAVAAADPEHLAELLGVAVGRAANIVAAAGKLVKG